MNADLKLTDALKKFLGINNSKGKGIEAGVQAAYAKAQDYMAGNLYVVEESKEQSVVEVDSNPHGGFAKEELKAKFVDMLAQGKGDFLWRQLSGRFQGTSKNPGFLTDWISGRGEMARWRLFSCRAGGAGS